MGRPRDISKILGRTEASNTANIALGTGAALDVYATKEDLPTTGLTEGDQAYVSGNRRFYISNGSGWYNVALINATPTLTISPAGVIELSTEGTATTITLTGTDSDNAVDGLTFSVESDGSFAGLASLSQDSSVFTITPLSEDSATTTSAVLTFKASDGISFGTGDRTLTLSFQVPNSNYTTALLKADVSDSDNQVDISTNNHSITEAGNVTSTALTPYHPGGYSTYFDGNDEIEVTEGSDEFGFGTSDYTIEWWFNVDTISGVQAMVTNSEPTDHQGCWYGLNNANLYILHGNGSNTWNIKTGSAVETNRWYHIAVVNNGGTISVYLDGSTTTSGISNYSQPYTWTDGNNAFHIGGRTTAANQHVTGYIRDVRIVKGTAVYTSNFTPPDKPLTAITNTSLLLCHLPYIADGSSNSLATAVSGNPENERFSPYDYKKYTKADYGGSVYFDGSGDYITGPSVTTGTTWTIETWVYPERHYSGSGHFDRIWAIGASTGDSLVLNIQNTGVVVYRVNDTIKITSSSNITLNAWTHVALVCDGSSTTLYFDGKSVGTVAETSSKTSKTFKISTLDNAQGYMKGYISDLRYVKGTAVYTSNFTPPTEPLTAITNTELLTCTNQNDIWNAGEGKQIVKSGSDASNTQRKFTTSSAIYFDGTSGLKYDPGVDNPLYNFSTYDWTIEFWFRPNSGSATYTLLSMIKNNSGSLHSTPHIYMASSNLYFYTDTNNRIVGGTPVSNTWHHLAVTRSGNVHRMFQDGTLIGSWTNAYTYAQGRLSLGNYYQSLNTLNGSNIFAGYMQDVRITKGLARYTAAFTPPTAEFTG